MLQILRQSWIMDSIPWIPDFSYWIPDPLPVDLGVRIAIVSGIPGFLELYSRFQSPWFLIPQEKISRGPECGFPCTCDTKTCQLQTDGTLELFLLKEELLTVTNAFQKLSVHNNA